MILTDLSHRILAWDRRLIEENIHNPYVDVVFLACDCADLPLADGSVDCVTSFAGFESMQKKMDQGFREALRVLRPGGTAIYSISLISSREDPNVRRWLELFQPVVRELPWIMEDIRDSDEWQRYCAAAGFASTQEIPIYRELPAPAEGGFPFENCVLQWMSASVCVSQKGGQPDDRM